MQTRRDLLGMALEDPARDLAKPTDLSLPKPQIIPLWRRLPEPAPRGLVERQDEGNHGIAAPRLEVFRPAAAIDRKRAVMVIPGGGYQRLVLDNEAYWMARWLVARGVTACVLIHRLPAEGWKAGPLAPLQDAQRGMRLIGAHAEGWGADPERLGLVGFSAGGHLAGMLATLGARTTYPTTDEADSLSTRPLYAALVYPVIGMETDLNHGVSRRNLIGDHPTPGQVRAWSVDKHVTRETPPTFLVHAADDPIVPVENSLRMLQTLTAADVGAELHVFETGGHGFGLVSNTTAQAWPPLFARWLETHDPVDGGAVKG